MTPSCSCDDLGSLSRDSISSTSTCSPSLEQFVHVSRDAIAIHGISKAMMASSTLSSSDIEALVEEKYVFGASLGKGSSAEVFRVVERATGAALACKIIRRDNRMNDTATMAGEVESLLALHGDPRHVAGLHELFVSRSALFLVMRLATGGDLLELLAHRLPAL